MSSVRSFNSGCTRIVGSYLRALPTTQVHPELDGRTLDIVHCFYNIAGHFSRLKFAFSALIKLQILQAHVPLHMLFRWQHFSLHVHVHVLFSLVALSFCFDASDVSATISDTFSKSSKSPRNPNSNIG